MSASLPPVESLPEGWALAKVTDCTELVTSGSRGWGKYYAESGAVFVRVGDFQRAEISLSPENFVYVSPPAGAEGTRTAVRPGDVLVTITADLGMVAVADLALGEAYVNQHVALLRPIRNLSSHCFAFSLLDPTGFQRAVRERQYGATKPGLSLIQLRDFEIKIPPRNEQQRIVDALDSYLSRLDAATESLKRAEANLKRYRASVLKAAVEGRLVPNEAELARQEGRGYEPASVLLERILKERRRRWEEAELAKMQAKGKVPKNDRWKSKYKEPVAPDVEGLPELPEGWCWATVDQVSSQPLINGRSVKSRSGGFPVLRLNALQETIYLDLAKAKEGDWTRREATRFLVREGDFLISRGNGSLHLVGRGGLVGPHSGAVAFPDTLVRLRLPGDELSLSFFAYSWRSQATRQQIMKKAKTTAGIFKVNQNDLSQVVVALPPKKEQGRIAKQLDQLLSAMAHLNAQVESDQTRIQRLRQSILKWAFEGKLVDQIPNDEPASVLLERIRQERQQAAPKKRARKKKRAQA